MTDRSRIYSDAFYRDQAGGSRESAEVILALLRRYHAFDSIVDFGCGAGTWLAAAAQAEVCTVVGLDGPWAAGFHDGASHIFLESDLEQPIYLSDDFDLAISVEVAEHLQEGSAPDFVDSLCRASRVVLFGAAVPGQGGDHHVHERWQSYWIELFEERGYGCFDIVRPSLWDHSEVEWWYRQNTLLFVHASQEGLRKSLQDLQPPVPADLVHPENFARAVRQSRIGKVSELREKIAVCDEPADVLRVLGNFFEKVDVEIALKIMKMALVDRPSGPQIKKRVLELESKVASQPEE